MTKDNTQRHVNFVMKMFSYVSQAKSKYDWDKIEHYAKRFALHGDKDGWQKTNGDKLFWAGTDLQLLFTFLASYTRWQLRALPQHLPIGKGVFMTRKTDQIIGVAERLDKHH